MESYQFPSTYTAISGLLDDIDNSKQWNFELWHYCTKATIYRRFNAIVSQLKMHYFSEGAFESLIASQLLKKEKYIWSY